jgi:uncharacterized protein
MRALATVAAFAIFVIPLAGQQREPIIDVHMHALAADAQGPPPLGMCTPFPEYSAWDPATPYGDLFIAKFKKPACADPIWSPTTDDEVMKQTLAIAERRNIVGVLSGPATRVAAWVNANPRRFIRGLSFQLADKDTPSPATLRAMHAKGELQVLGEVTNQYAGVLPRHVRIGSDGLAGNDRARDRCHRRGDVPSERAEARHLLQ